ncbi:MAG: sensor histidine kinase [Bacteroidia bacterium]
MYQIRNFIYTLTRLGVRPDLPMHEQERIIKLNKVYLLTIPACILGSLWSFDSLWFVAISLSISLFMQVSLLFHHLGWYKTANLYANITFDVLCSVLAIAFNGTTGTENYLFVSIFTVQMQYHFRKDISRSMLCIIIFALFVLVKIINHFPHPSLPIPQYAFVIYIQNVITIFFLILFLMHEYQTLVENYQQKIEEQNNVLAVKKLALETSNHVKDKLFSIIGHDLKKPLASVRGMITLLSQKLLSPEQEEKSLQQLLVLLDASDLTLKNLLDWGIEQQSEGKREAVDVYEYAEQNCQLYQSVAEQKNIRLLNHIPQGLYVSMNRHQLDFILRNLINNALKFTHLDGEVRIYIEDRDDQWAIAVADNGIGIKEEYLDKLFNLSKRFTTKGTAKESGTGLGLPLCKQFIEDNKGQLLIQSEEGKGSIFWVIMKKAFKSQFFAEKGQFAVC